MIQLDFCEKPKAARTTEHYKEQKLKSVLSQAWFHYERRENILQLLCHRSLGYPKKRSIYRRCLEQERDSLITSPTYHPSQSALERSISLHDSTSKNAPAETIDSVASFSCAPADSPYPHQCTLFKSGKCTSLDGVMMLLESPPFERPDTDHLIVPEPHDDLGAFMKEHYKPVTSSEDENYHLLGMMVRESSQSNGCSMKHMARRHRLNNLLSKCLESARHHRRALHAKAEERMLKSSPLIHSNIEGIPPFARAAFLVVCSSDGKLLASCHGDRTVRVSSISTGKCLRTLMGHRRTTWAVAFHPQDNDKMATGCLGGEVRIWYKDHLLAKWQSPLVSSVFSLSFHPFEDTLAIGCGSGLFLYDNFTYQDTHPRTLFTQSLKETVRFVRFSPCGKFLLTGIINPDELANFCTLQYPMPGHGHQTEIARPLCNCGCYKATDSDCTGPHASADGLESGRKQLTTLGPILSYCRSPHLFCAANPFTNLIWSNKLFLDWVGLCSTDLKAVLEQFLDREAEGSSNAYLSSLNFFRCLDDEFPLRQLHNSFIFRRHYDILMARSRAKALRNRHTIISRDEVMDEEPALLMVTQIVEEDVVQRELLQLGFRHFDACLPSLDNELRDVKKNCCRVNALGECQSTETKTSKKVKEVKQPPTQHSCFNLSGYCQLSEPNSSLTVAKCCQLSELSISQATTPKQDSIRLFDRTGLEKMQIGLYRANLALGQRSHWIHAAMEYTKKEEFGFSNTPIGVVCIDLAFMIDPRFVLSTVASTSTSLTRDRFPNGLLCSFINGLISKESGVSSFDDLDMQSFNEKFHWKTVGSPSSSESSISEELSKALFQPLAVTAAPHRLPVEPDRNLGRPSLLYDGPQPVTDVLPSTELGVHQSFKPVILRPRDESTHNSAAEETASGESSRGDFTSKLISHHHCCLLKPTQEYLDSIHEYTDVVRAIVGLTDDVDAARGVTHDFDIPYTNDASHAEPAPKRPLNPCIPAQSVRAELCRKANFADEELMSKMISSALSQEPHFDTQLSDVFQVIDDPDFADEGEVKPAEVYSFKETKLCDIHEESRNPLTKAYQDVRARICAEMESFRTFNLAERRDLLKRCHVSNLTVILPQTDNVDVCNLGWSLCSFLHTFYERFDRLEKATSESDVAGSSYYSDLVAVFLSCNMPQQNLTRHEARVMAKHYYQLQRDFFNVYGYVKFSYMMADDPLSVLSWLGGRLEGTSVFSGCGVPLQPLCVPVSPSFPPLPEDCINLHHLTLPSRKSKDPITNALRSMKALPLGSFSQYLFLLPNLIANLAEFRKHLLTSFGLSLNSRQFLGLIDYLGRSFQYLELVRIVVSALNGKHAFTHLSQFSEMVVSMVQSWLVQALDIISFVHRINIMTRESKRAGVQQFLIPTDKMDLLITGLSADLSLDTNVLSVLQDVFHYNKEHSMTKNNLVYIKERCTRTKLEVAPFNAEGRKAAFVAALDRSSPGMEFDFTDEQSDHHAQRHCEQLVRAARVLHEKEQHEPYFSLQNITRDNKGLTIRTRNVLKDLNHLLDDVSIEKLNPALFSIILPRPNRSEVEIREAWRDADSDERSTKPKPRQRRREVDSNCGGSYVEMDDVLMGNPFAFIYRNRFGSHHSHSDGSSLNLDSSDSSDDSSDDSADQHVGHVADHVAADNFPPTGFSFLTRADCPNTPQPERPRGRYWRASVIRPENGNKTATARIQLWPYDSNNLPDITDRCAHLVVPVARIHNDSSLALTKDWGRIAMLSPALASVKKDVLGIYTLLEGPVCARGTMLYSAEVSPKVISLSFSPSEAHLLLTTTGSTKAREEFSGLCQFVQLESGGELTVLRMVPSFKSRYSEPSEGSVISVNCGVWLPIERCTVALSCNNGAVRMITFK